MPSRRKISVEIEKIYELYFNIRVIRNVKWAPMITCTTCNNRLMDWYKGKCECMPFGIPMIWTNPQAHSPDNCYACANDPFGLNRRTRRGVDHKSVNSAQTPLPHSSSIPVPKRPSPTEEYAPPTFESLPESTFSLYQPSEDNTGCNHIEIKQERLNMMVRQLKLSQRQAIALSQHLKAVNILAPGVKVFGFRQRQQELVQFFDVNDDNTFAYCKNIAGVMGYMNIEYKAEDWRIFIDSSKRSLKAVLLYKDKTVTPIPIAISSNTKESYESMRMILKAVKYQEHVWKICADLKVVTLLTGLQSGYTKNMCFICLWNTRYNGNQYQKRDWMQRTKFSQGHANVINEALVPIGKILLPPLHIKLGLVKNFIKSLNPRAFDRLKIIFPRLSPAKIKEGSMIDFFFYLTK